MELQSAESIREIAKIAFEAKRPFESVPPSRTLREKVKQFKLDSKFKLRKKSKTIKFNPIGINWKLKNGTIAEKSSCGN